MLSHKERSFLEKQLSMALELLKQWDKSKWKDFVQEHPSPLKIATGQFLRAFEKKNGDCCNTCKYADSGVCDFYGEISGLFWCWRHERNVLLDAKMKGTPL